MCHKTEGGRNASASENPSDISTGRVLQRQITDVRGFCIVDCDQLQPMRMQVECVTAFGSGAACRAPITLEQRIACFKKAIEGNMTGPPPFACAICDLDSGKMAEASSRWS